MQKATVGLERREFLKSMGIGTIGLAGLAALAGCQPMAMDEREPAVTKENLTATPVQVDGERRLTYEEVDQLRWELVSSKEDYVCENGTIIPALYVKVRTLLNTIGLGIGSEVNDKCFAAVMGNFNEEEAEAYLSMPSGVMFTAVDWQDRCVQKGFMFTNLEDCERLAEQMASHGVLYRARRGGINYYHMCPEAHGIWEYNMDRYSPEYCADHYAQFSDITAMLLGAEDGFYYALPINKEVVDTGEILPLDDYAAHIARAKIIAVSPCQCRLSKLHLDKLDESHWGDHPLETCITTGEEAEYYIERGIGREITKEECLNILNTCVEDGMVIQSSYTKDTEVICCCHGDCCGILSNYAAMGDECGNFASNETHGHYELVHDNKTCTKCGMCAQKCPLFSVTMEGEDGMPTKNAACVGCGQCVASCPSGSRVLKLKNNIPELPGTFLEDLNKKSEYRFRTSQVY